MILIYSVEHDLHALEVRRRILAKGYSQCFIFEADRLAGRESLSLKIRGDGITNRVTTSRQDQLRLGDGGVIWFRRYTLGQYYQSEPPDPTSRDLINNECRETAIALFESEFHGKWISKPHATLRASNKLLQLIEASKCGFRIPDTIVTQSKQEALAFYDRHDGSVVVKAIYGTHKKAITTRLLENPREIDQTSYRSCPTLYQEFIPGNRHIRLHCFGSLSAAIVMDSPYVSHKPQCTD